MCLDVSVEDGGLIQIRPNGCPFAGNWAVFVGFEGWKQVDRVCLRYLDKSEVPRYVGLFIKAIPDFEQAFLAVWRGVRVVAS